MSFVLPVIKNGERQRNALFFINIIIFPLTIWKLCAANCSIRYSGGIVRAYKKRGRAELLKFSRRHTLPRDRSFLAVNTALTSGSCFEIQRFSRELDARRASRPADFTSLVCELIERFHFFLNCNRVTTITAINDFQRNYISVWWGVKAETCLLEQVILYAIFIDAIDKNFVSSNFVELVRVPRNTKLGNCILYD